MSFQDSAVIFFLALLLFGPKKLPELARQLGKLMGEFRRASNEFRMQMEDELRISEQAERQKQIAAIEAAAPATSATAGDSPEKPAHTYEELPAHPHEALSGPVSYSGAEAAVPASELPEVPEHSIGGVPEAPVAIASSGDLSLMPPDSGLPVGRTNSGVAQAFESIPQQAEAQATGENVHHG